MVSRLSIWVRDMSPAPVLFPTLVIPAAQGDHVDAARILLYYKSTLVDDVSSVRLPSPFLEQNSDAPVLPYIFVSSFLSAGLSLCASCGIALW